MLIREIDFNQHSLSENPSDKKYVNMKEEYQVKKIMMRIDNRYYFVVARRVHLSWRLTL
jgi:hypothetical protein